MTKIGVLGAGSWGTALAVLLADKHEDIALWEYVPDFAAALVKHRENRPMLPGIKIPEKIKITNELQTAVSNRDILVCAVPSHAVRSLANRLLDFDLNGRLVVSVTKGIENDTFLRMSQVFADVIPNFVEGQFVVLSGPSHAEEVSRNIPTTVVAACSNLENARRVQEAFMNATFRVYSHSDVTGVELGGSLKNIIAIAAGIIDGVGFGDNTKAALMTRGLVEITRLGTAMGAEPLTFAGLSGMGDLMVTCMSRHSRNRHVGEEIGKGKTLQQVLSEMVMVAEGVETTKAAHQLRNIHNVEMPITEEVHKVLFEDKPAKEAVYDLMTRGAKQEKFGT